MFSDIALVNIPDKKKKEFAESAAMFFSSINESSFSYKGFYKALTERQTTEDINKMQQHLVDAMSKLSYYHKSD